MNKYVCNKIDFLSEQMLKYIKTEYNKYHYEDEVAIRDIKKMIESIIYSLVESD